MNRSQKTVLGWGLGVFLATGLYWLTVSPAFRPFGFEPEPLPFWTMLLLWFMDAVVVAGLLLMNKGNPDQ